MSVTAERAEEKEASPQTLPPITFHDLIMSLFQPNDQHPRPKGKKEKRHGKRPASPK
jgi:hypothetical protein